MVNNDADLQQKNSIIRVLQSKNLYCCIFFQVKCLLKSQHEKLIQNPWADKPLLDFQCKQTGRVQKKPMYPPDSRNNSSHKVYHHIFTFFKVTSLCF